MNAPLTVEPQWVDESFWDEIEAMVPHWREPIPGLVNGSIKQALFPEESADPNKLYRTRAYVARDNEEQGLKGGEVIDGETSAMLCGYVRMIDPSGNLFPVPVKSCATPLADQTEYGARHIKNKLNDGWLLAEKSDERARVGQADSRKDKEYGEYLRKEYLKRRQKHAETEAKEELKFRSRAEKQALAQLKMQGEALTKIVTDTLNKTQENKTSDNQELATIIAQAVATAMAAANQKAK
jgi:hypothetical protein